MMKLLDLPVCHIDQQEEIFRFLHHDRKHLQLLVEEEQKLIKKLVYVKFFLSSPFVWIFFPNLFAINSDLIFFFKDSMPFSIVRKNFIHFVFFYISWCFVH